VVFATCLDDVCAVLAPMGDSIVLADDGHAANIEQPKAFNEALLGFLRAG
jgi:pimeloyl-ACP methyl ester carboxylesterase